MRLRLLLAAVALPLLLWAALPVVSTGQSGRLDELNRKIEIKRGLIGRKKGTERALGHEIGTYSRRIDRLENRIGFLRAREGRIQADLDRKRAELARLQAELRAERRRLVRLRAKLAGAQEMLADRLVELYTADRPDLVSVVLSSRGFADLLERGEFLRRINEQDERIIKVVRGAKADAIATERKLDSLEARQQRVTAQVLSRRNQVADVKQELIDTRVGYQGTRSDKRNALLKVRSRRLAIQEDLESLERESAKITAQLQRGPTGLPPGPIRYGSGQLIWPVSGPITGSFGEQRPGHIHAGLDIAAPTGTPIRAADAGRVVLLGWTGGYGNYTCVQHTSTMATCYAHQSRYGTSLGANVAQGQVIGYVGNTGHSFGAHLHFEVRINGTPVNPLGYL
jgi:murein DD-endopeptidase MepM/ murein hydrolase activator NlpD